MTITQTIEIPADHRLTIEVPPEIPAGPARVAFTALERKLEDKSPEEKPVPSPLPGGNARTVEEALRMVDEKRTDPNRGPISRFF